MSTFDDSSALPMMLPRPPVAATPTLAMPDDALSEQRFDPIFTSPFGLLKVAIASWPTTTVWPAPKVATICPVLLMTTLSTWPAAEPFWLIDDVADGDAKLVRMALAPTAGTTSQLIAFGVAP